MAATLTPATGTAIPAAQADAGRILERVRGVSAQFAQERNERQRRRALDVADFDRLVADGFLLAVLPAEFGGTWEDAPHSTRVVCDLLRTLAHGDSSVALVCAMHPAVLASAGWLVKPAAPSPWREAWAEQRRWVFRTAAGGAWWGTIMSEPGSGGDLSKTGAVARHEALDGQIGRYRISGVKHFGSGSGVASYMITSAVPEGEAEPDTFFMDMRGVPWDGSAGVKLVAPWDGQGMTATQSHAMAFEDFPATRLAWPGTSRSRSPSPYGPGAFFSAVIVGIVEVAVEAARRQLEQRRGSLRAYEQVEWARANMEAWLIQQAFEGMLRAIERQEDVARSTLTGKEAIAEFAESVLARMCRVIGGGTYSRHSPFGFWLEDVRALGFLRPPWALAYERLFDGAWAAQP